MIIVININFYKGYGKKIDLLLFLILLKGNLGLYFNFFWMFVCVVILYCVIGK